MAWEPRRIVDATEYFGTPTIFKLDERGSEFPTRSNILWLDAVFEFR